MKFDYLAKMLVLLSSAVAITFIGVNQTVAQTGGSGSSGAGTGSSSGGGGSILSYLQDIDNNTLTIVSDLTNYVAPLYAMWMQPDQTDTTSNLLTQAPALGNLINQELTTQVSQQSTLNTDLLGDNAKSIPYANDLVYSSILGAPFYSKDPRGKNVDYVYNYIRNAGGMTIAHLTPSNGWQGSKQDRQNYQNFYNTVMAVESFNGYILAGQYADKVSAEGQQNLNSVQQALITWINTPPSSGSGSSSNSNSFLAQVAGEPIGLVLRQLLIVQSQVFVLLTQLVQTQKQMVTAQAMTNALLVLSSGNYETVLVSKAQGINPR